MKRLFHRALSKPYRKRNIISRRLQFSNNALNIYSLSLNYVTELEPFGTKYVIFVKFCLGIKFNATSFVTFPSLLCPFSSCLHILQPPIAPFPHFPTNHLPIPFRFSYRKSVGVV